MLREDLQLRISWSQNPRHPKTSNRHLKMKCPIPFRIPWRANSCKADDRQLASLWFLICEHLFLWSSQWVLFCIWHASQVNSFCRPLFHTHPPFTWLFQFSFSLRCQGCLICMVRSPIQCRRCWACRELHKQLQWRLAKFQDPHR